MWGHREDAVCGPGSWISPDFEFAGPLILAFQPTDCDKWTSAVYELPRGQRQRNETDDYSFHQDPGLACRLTASAHSSCGVQTEETHGDCGDLGTECRCRFAQFVRAGVYAFIYEYE